MHDEFRLPRRSLLSQEDTTLTMLMLSLLRIVTAIVCSPRRMVPALAAPG